ncbi:unnamed protein product [Diatraea saccharalis]|uniref:Leucine-rich repeat-containing protein 71 n=1 Tax=Diatraea saccharalis TaxID=40085 RepID=A0A9N9RGD3_9NEOP|nr:unnamed protein product [Diatraea saccharalis]
MVEDEPQRPNPTDFDIFLPWACQQLQLHTMVQVVREEQQEYVSATTSERTKVKTKPKAKEDTQTDLDSEVDQLNRMPAITYEDILYINAVYNYNNNLVQIKFANTCTIPRLVLKIIGLIIKYHTHLTSIIINKGINEYSMYELGKLLPLSNITDICLDGTYLKNANYQLLFEQQSSMRQLSLARCSIDDVVLEVIANALIHPSPASKFLSILNLSSNIISDSGIISLANALRTNRALNYLNLSNNMISDRGMTCILDTLVRFPLSLSELVASRSRHIEFMKDKSERIMNLATELRSYDIDKRSIKQKSMKTLKKGKVLTERDTSLKNINEIDNSNQEALFEKATAIVEATLGSFKDPFNKNNTFVKDNITYCFGNNSLYYLNVSYNNWSYLSLKKLLTVLIYQKTINRKPRGLINLSIEGNLIPEHCKELSLIDSLLNECLSLIQRDVTIPKKKTLTKTNK